MVSKDDDRFDLFDTEAMITDWKNEIVKKRSRTRAQYGTLPSNGVALHIQALKGGRNSTGLSIVMVRVLTDCFIAFSL
jgi:hypothetical protein